MSETQRITWFAVRRYLFIEYDFIFKGNKIYYAKFSPGLRVGMGYRIKVQPRLKT